MIAAFQQALRLYREWRIVDRESRDLMLWIEESWLTR